MNSWYGNFRAWADEGNCERLEGGGIDPFKKTMEPVDYQVCANTWFFETPEGKTYQYDLAPRFRITWDQAMRFWKQYRLASLFTFGNCDKCEDFWHELVDNYIGIPKYDQIDRYLSDPSCDVRIKESDFVSDDIEGGLD